MNWKAFFQGLAAASAAGASQAALQSVSGQVTSNNGKVEWKPVGQVALIGAVLAALVHVATPKTAAQ